MKYTLCITRQCNLNCSYCYIGKEKVKMLPTIARAAINFAFENTPAEENIDIGFFGGEPLLEFELIKEITGIIEDHHSFDPDRVILTVVTNGTIFSDKIADFLKEHQISFNLSCDGPSFVQNEFRSFPDGKGSAAIVEDNIRRALDIFSAIPVNAVYHPRTIRYLPQVIEYFSSLGIRHIYLNPDFSAPWSAQDASRLPEIFDQIGKQYVSFYEQDEPHYISLIDGKITVIIRGGYQPLERCRMGEGEFAFSPLGNIYPCERLIGSDKGDKHCIGNITKGFKPKHGCTGIKPAAVNLECQSCGFKNYCMNWCGCSNFFSSKHYNKVGPFLCASERESIKTAFQVFQTLDAKLGPMFFEHLAGFSHVNSAVNREKL